MSTRKSDRQGGLPQCGLPVLILSPASPGGRGGDANAGRAGLPLRRVMRDPRARWARIQELKRSWRLTWQRERDMLSGADGAGTAAPAYFERRNRPRRVTVTPAERRQYLEMLWARASGSPAARGLAPIVRYAVSG